MLFGNPVRGIIVTRLTAGRFYRSQRYGCTGSVWEPRLGACAHFHRAIDISYGGDACGRDVLAAAAGTVLYVGTLNDGSDAVVIRHAGGWATGYGHCHGVVHKGQKVGKGQQSGDMNKSGVATGCHVHFAMKKDFPVDGDVNDFWLDDPKYGKSGNQPNLAHGTGKGTWVDPWPQLAQNVTVNPKSAPVGIRIRTAPNLNDASIYAETATDDHIRRTSDNADLGLAALPRTWGGTVTGASYTIGGATSSRWEKMWLGNAYRYVATLLAERSAS